MRNVSPAKWPKGQPIQIEAIPTEYAGMMFQSKLAATWAHSFDMIGVCWEYEPMRIDKLLLVEAFLERHPGAQPVLNEPWQLYDAILSDPMLHAPGQKLAVKRGCRSFLGLLMTCAAMESPVITASSS